MRWVVVGAGAVGASIGARLAKSGADVVLVARGEHGSVMAERGLTLRTPQWTEVLHLTVAAGPDGIALRQDDVLVMSVKTQHTAAAVRDWALAPLPDGSSAGRRLPMVCAQNGIENERLAARWFDTVIGACVWLPATHLSPGEVVASGDPLTGMLQIGRYGHPTEPADDTSPDPTGPADPLAQRLAAAMDVEGLRVIARPDVMRWKRGKLVDNLKNALDAVMAEPPQTWRPLVREVVAEAHAAMAALGLAVTSLEEERATRGDLVTATDVPGAARGGSSTWQSLQRGVDTEVEYLNGEIARMGREAGVPTPVNAALVRLVTAGQRAGRGPRWLSTEELRAEAG